MGFDRTFSLSPAGSSVWFSSTGIGRLRTKRSHAFVTTESKTKLDHPSQMLDCLRHTGVRPDRDTDFGNSASRQRQCFADCRAGNPAARDALQSICSCRMDLRRAGVTLVVRRVEAVQPTCVFYKNLAQQTVVWSQPIQRHRRQRGIIGRWQAYCAVRPVGGP